MEGATYYHIYWDYAFGDNCELRQTGRGAARSIKPVWCEELALRVTETTLVHTYPDWSRNYYWVVACNSEGFCSRIDSKNPAILSQ